MAIKITSEQIPVFWEAIKFACVNADFVPQRHTESYLNKLLYELLSGKAQCFVRLSDKKSLQAIAVTKILEDEVTGVKSLRLKCLYSFQKHPIEDWMVDFEILKKFAIRNNCKNITGLTQNSNIIRMSEVLGFEESLRTYIYRLED